ncbi:MAG: DNRLRE domain-containing protein [bacterium]
MRKTALLLGMFLIIVLPFMLTVSHAQTTVTIQQGVNGYTQGRDTFITQLWDADDNLGGHEYLECDKEDVDIGRILVYFGLSGVIPDDASISEARLELYNFDEEWDEQEEELSAYRMTAEWIEGAGTKDTIYDIIPNQSGAYWGHSGYSPWNGGAFDSTLLDRITLPARPGISSDGGWFSWTITGAVQAWYTGSAPNYGIILRGDGFGEWAVHYFRSNEYSDPSLHPRLVITYTVNGTINHPPACEAGTYGSYTEGSTVNLTGTASDLDGDPLTYLWTQVSGPSVTILNDTTLGANFEAPEVGSAGAIVVVRLTVNDGHGGTAFDEATISITDSTGPSGAIIIDHTCMDISQVPVNRIEAAKSNLRIWYGHTSHGSQITSGMEAMADSLFSFNSGPGSLSYVERTDMDLGHEGDLAWRDATVTQLNMATNDRNVVIWSWCGGVSDNTESGINTYLQAMNQLETDYPYIKFVYMTGHLDGTGETGNLHIRNNQIRDYCRANNKILFDFADIESYNPDGNYYLDRESDDNCDYYEGGVPRNWAQEWCAANPGECSSCECAHSQSLNCDLKARAFWWMLARIADWDPNASPVLQGLLDPNDLVYLGAFRLPDSAPGSTEVESWEYGGEALAYRPDGDPGGDADGYPGSLFGTGNATQNYVSEISIPAPGLSRNLNELNTAVTIQGFHDVRGGLFEAWDELPRVGLEYLPAQGEQTSPKLYLAFGQHLHGDVIHPTHGWCDINLSSPNTAGGWYIGNESLYNTTGYIFTIPQEWADIHTGGAALAAGRYRDGGLSGMGPSMFAYSPWIDGNPPAPGTHLDSHRMLLYSSRLDDPTDFRMNDYRDPDEWEGGAWITAGDRAAVVFVGTKATGDYWWYGFTSPAGDGMPCVHVTGDIFCFNADGTSCPSELAGYCEGHVAESRGWWSSRFDAQMIFYNPANFASVLNGTMESYGPQPYATLDIDEHLFLNATVEQQLLGTGDQRRYRIGEMAYDRERNYLYVFERFADGSKPVVHVWGVSSSPIITVPMDIPAGWSMISIPLIPENASVSSIFPDAVVVYGYAREVGYERIPEDENLEVGRGYWILFNTEQNLTLTGQPIPNYTLQTDEGGWAMVGGCSSDAETSSHNCNIGVIYGFVQGAGYQRITESEAIKPGKGYWILLNNVTGQAQLRVEATGGP